MNKNTRWAYTTWEKPLWRKPQLIQFEIYQLERCPTNFRQHYQGYVEFFKPYSRTQVKHLMGNQPNMHVEEAEKSREMNMMYCTKPESYSGERYMYNGPNEVFHQEETHKKVLSWAQIKDLLKVEME